MKRVLKYLTVLIVAGIGGVVALGFSDWPAGYALRYGLWRR